MTDKSSATSAASTSADVNKNTPDVQSDYITVYTSSQPCNKAYVVTNGIVEKAEKQPSYWGGIAVKKHVPTIEALAVIIQEISDNPNQCWGTGFHPTMQADFPYKIMSAGDVESGIEDGTLIQDGVFHKEVSTNHIVTTRSIAGMSPSSYILFDKDDSKPGEEDVSLSQWIDDMASFIPDFEKVDKIIIPSNSSRVGLKKERWHCYVKINDPMDTYSLRDRLLSAGNAAGHGFMKMDKSGKELSRTITDCSIFTSERVIYDGKPICTGIEIKPSVVEVTKGTVRTLDTSLIKEVEGYGEFKRKKVKFIDADGKESTRFIRKSTGQYIGGKLQWDTPVEMKLVSKTVTKTMQQVVDEGLIEKHGIKDKGKGKKLRCQSTFDDRGSKSFNGILRIGIKSGTPQIYDNGSDTTYVIKRDTAEMFAGVLDSTDSPGGTGGSIIESALKMRIDILHDYSGDHSHSDIAELVGKVYFFENARYVHLYDKWFLWNGKFWAVDETLLHLSLIQEVLKKRASEVIKQADARTDLKEPEREKITKWAFNEAKTLKSAPFKMNIDSTIKADRQCAVLPDIFDSNLRTIGTPNGTVNLVSGATTPALRDEYISKQTRAGANQSLPVIFLNFLDRIFSSDADIIAFIQRIFGYSLTGQVVEEKLFFLYGKGSNGKSKLLEILFYVLGDYARRAPASMFAEQSFEKHPTELAGLKGARLVVGSEIPDKMTWNEQVVKDLTGGDAVTARLMRQDYFDFKPQFTIVIPGNHKPRLRNVDEAMARRMVLIPFNVTIPKEERDSKMSDKLKAEAGSILNWCIQGAVDYSSRGLQIPESVSLASKEYLESEDQTGEFIETCLQKVPHQKVKFGEVFFAYKLWMKSQGFEYIKTEPMLRKELKERGFDMSRSNNIHWMKEYLLIPSQPLGVSSPPLENF